MSECDGSYREDSRNVMYPPFLKRNSIEYLFCVGTLCIGVVYFFCIDIGRVSCQHAALLSDSLVPAWPPFCCLGSNGMDVKDTQWYQFSLVLPIVIPAFAFFLCISHRLRRRETGKKYVQLHILHIISGLVIGFGISGPRFLFTIFLLLGNFYAVGKLQKTTSTLFMTIMWGTHIALLFINSYFDGYRFAWFGLEFLDTMVDPLMQWTVHYNMSVLRMIAFNTDMREAIVAALERRQKTTEKHDMSCIECAEIRELNTHKRDCSVSFGLGVEGLRCYKFRTEYPLDVGEYNLLSYLGYIFYPPLYIAGPISSFNAYVSYLKEPSRRMDRMALLRYALRTVFSFLVMTATVHYVYVVAILMNESVFTSISFSRRAVVLFLVLVFLWLKFNCVWKFFRFIALLDGFDVPEDMRRCFSNTVSIRDFWRDWHASFNLWIVRYMYIPMGGNKRKHLNIFPIFFFIAIWHDIELWMIHWACIICVCFLVELFLTQVVFHSRAPIVVALEQRPLLYRYIRTIGACAVMLQLLIANLVGFGVGLDKARHNVRALWTESPLSFRLLMVFYFYLAATVAIQHRDQEKFEEQQRRVKYGLVGGKDKTPGSAQAAATAVVVIGDGEQPLKNIQII
ncbi:putative GUP1 [Trypanosoma rangeli]|uniref:Putative GUP1 n=1 Tax=Trypanosoma rangeli TaxID=5698 RepID=A0A3S5IRW9_TRYRA|nr:putative GUP1 [Trypanosoma rangeli]RNF09178.1 putative GUP1 [Trypanosoma rangeli]|eukprot:RNF09178.1 putative GUP1 [Trypanosoma rangeli]